MPPRSAVDQLPEEVREWLQRELQARAFGGYVELAEALAARGYQISKSALHSYGQKFEERIGALRQTGEMAKLLTESLGDDAGAIGEALTAVTHQRLFDLAMKVKDPEDADLLELARTIANVNRASVAQKKWAAEVKARIQQAEREKQEAAAKLLRGRGISEDTVEDIKALFLGFEKAV